MLGDSAIDWLIENPGTILLSEQGRALAIAIEPGRIGQAKAALETGHDDFPTFNTRDLDDRYIRKLRRRAPILALDVDHAPLLQVEWRLFQHVYKGITDLVTKYVWPVPAFLSCMLFSRMSITPNHITFLSLILTVLAAFQFYESDFISGLACAWLMTFLDTVDGKLARVTATSSKFGDILDHGIDYIHPPVWWLCLAWGLYRIQPDSSLALAISVTIILTSYIVGRFIEIRFKQRFSINPYTWRRSDSLFRAIVARRNIILLIFTLGLLAGIPVQAFVASAVWCVVSVIIQAVRFHQASSASTREPILSWML